jgi:enterochelin esterase-like enzyme
MTRRQNEVAPVVITPLNVSDDIRNKIFVTIDGRDWQKDLSELGLTFDSSERDIMSRLTPLIQEEFNQDISDAYKIRKAVNSQNIYCIPNSVAGVSL